jgi:hypothetical protein
MAEGEPLPPLRSRTESMIALLGGLGVHADIAVAPALAVGVGVRAVAMAPRAGVAVGKESSPIELPAIVASVGARVGL